MGGDGIGQLICVQFKGAWTDSPIRLIEMYKNILQRSRSEAEYFRVYPREVRVLNGIFEHRLQ